MDSRYYPGHWSGPKITFRHSQGALRMLTRKPTELEEQVTFTMLTSPLMKVEGLLGQKELYIVYLQVGLSNPTLATG